MLRLPPSQIDLGPNDLSWHLQRLRRRQIERAAGFPTEITHTQQDIRPYSQGQRGSLSYHFPHPPSTRIRNVISSVPNDSIISEESVPQDSRLFWDGVVAEAGNPLWDLHRDSSSGASQLVAADTSDASAENIDPTALSDQESLEHVHSQEYSSLDGEYADYLAGSEENPSVHSWHSSEPGQSDPGEDNYYMDQSGQEEENENCLGAVNHLRLIESEKAALQSVEEDLSDLQRRFFDQMDLGGSADRRIRRRTRHLPLTAELDIDPLPGSVIRRTGLSVMGDDSTVDDEIQAPSSPLISPSNETTSPPPPQGIETYRHRTATLSRSRLHISHTAVSSSPEKRGRAQDSTSVDTAQDSSLLAHPPRRHKNYKARSESYSLVGSEVERDVTSTYEDPMPDGAPTELPSSPPELIGFYDGASVLHHSSPYRDLSQHSLPYDLSLQHSISRHLSTGLHLTPILPRNQLRNVAEPSPGLPLNVLPPPFSASERTVSFNLTLPSSSPTSQHSSPLSISLGSAYILEDEAASTRLPSLSTRSSLPSVRPQRSQEAVFQARLSELNHTIAYHASETYQYPTPARRSQYRIRTPITTPQQPQSRRYVPSPSPPPPMTPHRSMRVYDDRLPAYSQPQTPANIRRHRTVDAAFTAPARFARSRVVTPTSRPRRGTRTPSSRMGRRGLGRSDSPVMQSSLLIDEDQENISVDEELERRMAALRSWRSLGNREREEREGRLESTPPRGTSYDWA